MVVDAQHFHSGLLPHLALDGVLERFSRFNKARYNRVKFRWEAFLGTREQ